MKKLSIILILFVLSCSLFVLADRTLYYSFHTYSLFSYTRIPFGTKCGPANRLSDTWSFGGAGDSYTLELRDYEYNGITWQETDYLPILVDADGLTDSIFANNIIDYAVSKDMLIISLEDTSNNVQYIMPERIGKQYVNILLTEDEVSSMKHLHWAHLNHRLLEISLLSWLPLLLLTVGMFLTTLYFIDKLREDSEY